MEGPQIDLEREVTSKFSLLEGQLQTKLFTQVNKAGFYFFIFQSLCHCLSRFRCITIQNIVIKLLRYCERKEYYSSTGQLFFVLALSFRLSKGTQAWEFLGLRF
jgi:hypothetical protein